MKQQKIINVITTYNLPIINNNMYERDWVGGKG